MIKKYLGVLSLIAVLILSSIYLSGCGGDREYIIFDAEDSVAELTIFTFDGASERKWGLMNLGHSFLSLKNTSSDVITLSHLQIEPNEEVAIGTWSILEHFGIWYNVEPNYIAGYDKYNGRLSITQKINLDEVDKVSKYIDSHDDWSIFSNCSKFAINLWNEISTASEKIDHGLLYTPSKLKSEISNFSGFEYNRPISTRETFGYYDGEKFVSHNFGGGNNESN